MNGGGWTGLVLGGLTGLGTGSFGGFLAMAVIGCLVGIISDPDRRKQDGDVNGSLLQKIKS